MLDPKPFLAVSVILALPAAALAQSCPSVGGGASLTYTAESVYCVYSPSGPVSLQSQSVHASETQLTGFRARAKHRAF
jgi:hypothetical protein